MSRPVLTANVCISVGVDPRNDLSVTRNIRVNVVRYGTRYHVTYTTVMGVPFSPPMAAPLIAEETPEAALQAGVYDLLINVSAILRENIEGEPE